MCVIFLDGDRTKRGTGAHKDGAIDCRSDGQDGEEERIQDMKNRIYISGPITNTKDAAERFQAAEDMFAESGEFDSVINPQKLENVLKYAAERFQAAEDMFTESGEFDSVINPQKLENVLKDGNHNEYMELCKRLLNDCNVVYLLDGWENSNGAKEEAKIAISIGKEIRTEKSSQLMALQEAGIKIS